MKRLPLIVTLFLLLPLSAIASDRYISDILRVDLRTGASTQHRIIAILKSGTKLSVLEEPADSDWVRVVTEKGTEGWLRKQYLVSAPIARDQLAEARAQREQLATDKKQQDSTIQQLNSELSKYKTLYKKAETAKDKISSDHSNLQKISSNAVKLDQQNRLLIEEKEARKIEIEQLKQENLLLKNDQYIEGLVHGIIAVVLGAILAMVAPRINVGRKKSEW